MRRSPGAVAMAMTMATVCLLSSPVDASIGDRLPEFRDCVATCDATNCKIDSPTSIPLHRRLLLWDCAAECDYACQHIVTDARLHRWPPHSTPVHQFHGKWPFYRFLGMQEPFSVLFSALNYAAHAWGLAQIRSHIPASYPLRRFYVIFAYTGLAAWTASMAFHTRDYVLTERADYFAAGASVLYGLYFAVVRIFRLDDPEPRRRSVLRVWTALCVALYIAHVAYLSLVRWNYSYNMGANIAVGIAQNALWTTFAWRRYSRSGRFWQAWPGMIVAWILLAMSLEVLDFAPWKRMLDAHSLWHLGTVGPTIWWYWFLIKDAQEDTAQRWKA